MTTLASRAVGFGAGVLVGADVALGCGMAVATFGGVTGNATLVVGADDFCVALAAMVATGVGFVTVKFPVIARVMSHAVNAEIMT